VLKAGRSLSFTEAEVYAEGPGPRTLVMKASATMALVAMRD
jgi:acyl-coenzyme A thioesterase PaaI-like protein